MLVLLDHVTKRFEYKNALINVSLTIEPGHVIGLLGSNGSGKSTLLRHIIGLYLPDSGSCCTLGRNSAELRAEELSKIGCVHQEDALIPWMRAKHFIRYVSAFYPWWNHKLEQDLLDRFRINTEQKISKMSPGERQRLAIVAAICHEPKLLLLDEPASALDPDARLDLLDLIIELVQDGTRTIVISSHLLTDVEKVADHVLLMRKGRLIRDCSIDDLRGEFLRAHLTAPGGESCDDTGESKGQRASLAPPFTLNPEGDERQTSCIVQRDQAGLLEEHCAREQLACRWLPLTLEETYRLLMRSN